MNRRVFDGTPGSGLWLLIAVTVLVVAGGIAWIVAEDGGSERGVTAVGEADVPPPPDAREPLVIGAEPRDPRARERPRDRGDGSRPANRSGRRSGEPSDKGRPADGSERERRDETKPAPDIERLIEEGLDGRGGEEGRDRPPDRIRSLLQQGLGDGGEETPSGPPSGLEDALEEIARGG